MESAIHRKTIVIATQNRKKGLEITEILRHVPGVSFRGIEDFPFLPHIEEDGTSFRENAVKKAILTARACNTWAMADDSGLEIDALEGRPGIYSSRYAGQGASDEKNIEKALSELRGAPKEKRTARFLCSIALASPHQIFFVAEGCCEGIILEQPRGKGGFGYDPIFLVPDYNQTFAELTEQNPQIKNSISHRGIALKQFKERLIPLLRRF